MRGTVSLRDRYGLALTTASALAVERYVDGLDRHLSWDLGARQAFEGALAADESFALAHAGRAVVCRFQGDATAARASAARACALAASASLRERQHALAVAAFVGGQAARALALLRAHLSEYPRDALALQLATVLLAFSGPADRRERLAGLLDDLAPAYGDDWWFLGVRAYAYQEHDQLELARSLAERSLSRRPRNTSAVHALAHVFYETDDHASGIGFLGDWLGRYPRAAPYYTHLSWHLALGELVQGRLESALATYDRAIDPAVSSASTTLADASSLLWRAELYGLAAEPLPWMPVCELAARTADPRLAFAAAHAALAYAAAGQHEASDRLIAGLRASAHQGNTIAREVVLPLVEGIAAFGRGEYARAAERIAPVSERIVQLGGTNAQREVFEETLLVAHLRAGQGERAEALIRRRLDRRPSARDRSWLASAHHPGTPALLTPDS